MSALLHLMMGSARRKQLVTRTFTSNATFPIPAGVTVLLTASGKGAAGTPASSGTTEYYVRVQTTLYRRDGGANETYTEDIYAYGWGYGTGNGSDYCDPIEPDNSSTVYYQSRKCYDYRTRQQGSTPATTGASSTGFGRTFPGGSGGAASTTTFNNVAVTPLNTYSIVVPSGGSITITYEI